MSSVSLSELILLFVIGLLILGPERLPRVASQIGRWVGRARRTANQLRYQLEREVALAEFEEAKKKKSDAPKKADDKQSSDPSTAGRADPGTSASSGTTAGATASADAAVGDAAAGDAATTATGKDSTATADDPDTGPA